MSLNPVHADPRVRSSLQQHGTPARRRSNSFASNHTLSGHFSVKKQMSRETSREFVGPMPIGEFFNNFLKIESMRRMPKVKANHFDTLPRASVGGGGILETDLYDPMVCYQLLMLSYYSPVRTFAHRFASSKRHVL